MFAQGWFYIMPSELKSTWAACHSQGFILEAYYVSLPLINDSNFDYLVKVLSYFSTETFFLTFQLDTLRLNKKITWIQDSILSKPGTLCAKFSWDVEIDGTHVSREDKKMYYSKRLSLRESMSRLPKWVQAWLREWGKGDLDFIMVRMCSLDEVSSYSWAEVWFETPASTKEGSTWAFWSVYSNVSQRGRKG